MGTIPQQDVFWSLRASGSVWELLGHNPRVVKSQSWLGRCSGLQVSLGVPVTGLGALTTSLEASESTINKSGSADHKPGNISNHHREARDKHHILCKCCWCTWISYLLLIVQRLLNLVYSVCILISECMYLYSYPSTHGISRLSTSGAWVQLDVGLKMAIKWTQRSSWRPWSREFGGRGRVSLTIYLEAVIEWTLRRTWR